MNASVAYMLEKAASVLGPMLSKLVFTGGAVVPIYLDKNPTEFRPTQDVDCVIEVAGRASYGRLEEELRRLGLKNDIQSGVICRWIADDILIDIMPTDKNILGFTNSWYKKGLENGVLSPLPSGKRILVFTYEHLLCSKIEAFWSRGAGDILTSKDMEDVVMLLAFSSRADGLLKTDNEILRHLAEEFRKLLSLRNYLEEIGGFFLPDKKSQAKVREVAELMNNTIVLGKQ